VLIVTEYNHIHLDAVGGLAGDMFVAAMLDALPELRQRVFDDLATTLPPHCGTPALTEGLSGGVAACRFILNESHTEHCAGDDHAGHSHDHAVFYPEIASSISSGKLHPGTAEHALAILRRLAEAESRTHRVPVDKVHFHEIADWDSLMDVVAAGSISAALEDCSWSVSELPRGNGLVRTSHGLLPVPAPATVEILRGYRWRDDGIGGERVTPTGAAILAHVAKTNQVAAAHGTLCTAGTGAGTRELAGMPNILRALVFSSRGTETKVAPNGVTSGHSHPTATHIHQHDEH
jgi:uncharacterized protein (DUF111 family)